MKTIFTLAILLVSAHSAFAADTTITNDRNSVDQACTNEGHVAQCGNDVVGKVLFKCIHDYKKTHKDTFQISAGCKSAIDKLHADKKAGK